MAKDETVTGELVPVSELAMVAALSRAEIDTQISTARAYPRSMAAFREEMGVMVSMSEDIASECIFALPRGKGDDGSEKFIEGASIRFAEIALYNFGNARAGAKLISEGEEYVVCEGYFHDLEKNVAVQSSVSRRIVNKWSKRFNADMIAITINAACALAKRNAILQGIPKAIWKQFYDLARTTAIGDEKTLVAKRTAMMAYFAKMSVSAETIIGYLCVKSVDEISLDDLAVLKGIATAIKEGAVSVDKAFTTEGDDVSSGKGKAGAVVDAINKAASGT